MSRETKQCRGACGETKPFSVFGLRSKTQPERGRVSYCRPCEAARVARYRGQHPERAEDVRAYLRAYRQSHLSRLRALGRQHYAANRDLYLTRARARWERLGGGRGRQRLLLSYPYLSDTTLEGADLLMRINALVPQHLPSSMRADVCQELALSVLMGEIKPEEIDAHIGTYVRRQFNALSSKYCTLYLDGLSARARESVEAAIGANI
jgi:hypothetical protein